MDKVFDCVFRLPLPCNGKNFYFFSKFHEIFFYCSFKGTGKNSDLITNQIARQTSFYYHAVEVLILCV